MMLSRRTFALTSLGLAAAATLAACSSKSKDEATEEGKMALIVSDAGDAAAEALSKAVEAFTKETKVEVDIKPVSDVSQELARGITAEPSIDVVVLNPAQLSSYAGSLHSWDKGAAAVKDAHPALLTSATRQGKIAAAPRDVSTLALYINTSLWSAAGLSDSDYPTTWEQLDQVAAKLTSGGVVGLTLDASYTRVGAFMIQGGGFDAKMQQKPTRSPIPLESRNGLKNDRGTIAMARTSVPDSATAQFFINTVNNNGLNYPQPDGNGYAVFGKVIEGMETVDKIAQVQTTRAGMHADVPREPVIIESVERVK